MKENEKDLSTNSTKDGQNHTKKENVNMTEKYGAASSDKFVPLPTDATCTVCGRHINELKPFGGLGDPLVGDYNGAVLVRNKRAFFLYEGDEPQYETTWECRDCILLEGDNFYERLSQRKANDLKKADTECRDGSGAPNL